MQLIQPKLVKNFNCLADRCPSTCCRDWDIVWHENEVRKLNNSDNESILNKLSTSFYQKDQYRLIKFNKDGICPFLTGEGLCQIHKELGEEYLSYVCREYPRISRVCGDIVLSSCKTSCYAVTDYICRYSDSMDMIVSDNVNTTSIVSTEEEGKRRADIFRRSDNAKNIPIYNNVVTKDIFSEIFGWEIITAKTDEERKLADSALRKYCCEEFRDNLKKAMFLEWIINNFYDEATDQDNLRCFAFCAEVTDLVIIGAAYAAEDRDQFICTICDFISFLLSNTKKIIMYLAHNN